MTTTKATSRARSAAHAVPGTAYLPRVDRTVTGAWQRPSGQLVPTGAELSVRGERGRFILRAHVRLADGREWLDLVHPQYGFKSVRPERVRVVHRARKVRPARYASKVAA